MSKKLKHQNRPDSLGDRMKGYEDAYRFYLPKRSYLILRLDGKAFHTLTKGLQRPYDKDFAEIMNQTAMELCRQIQGSQFAYVQSDEISILVTDLGGKLNTENWFGNNLQKMVSVSASIATWVFNCENMKAQYKDLWWEKELFSVPDKPGYFDSRVFLISDKTEVNNYFYWRWLDCERNSVSMAAQANYSHKELQGKNKEKMLEMLVDKYYSLPQGFKNGRFVLRDEDKQWIVKNSPFQRNDREFVQSMIPDYSFVTNLGKAT